MKNWKMTLPCGNSYTDKEWVALTMEERRNILPIYRDVRLGNVIAPKFEYVA